MNEDVIQQLDAMRPGDIAVLNGENDDGIHIVVIVKRNASGGFDQIEMNATRAGEIAEMLKEAGETEP